MLWQQHWSLYLSHEFCPYNFDVNVMVVYSININIWFLKTLKKRKLNSTNLDKNTY